MPIRILILASFLLTCTAVYSDPGQQNHQVLKGDTLWDLANTYYKNPWQWKKIWKVNKALISNPDLIFPSQTLVIPELGAKSAETAKPAETKPPAKEEANKAVQEKPAAEATASKPEVKAAAADEKTEEITPEDMNGEALAKETTAEAKVEPAAQKKEEAKSDEKQVEELLETAEKTAPETKEAVPQATKETAGGTELESALEQELKTETEAEKPEEAITPPAAAETEGSGEQASQGISFKDDSAIVPPDFIFDGKIVRDKENKMIIAQFDTVYIDMGSNQGLKPDTKLYVLRKIGNVTDPSTGSLLGYTIKKVGMLKTTDSISQTASGATVTRSYEPLKVGDLVQVFGE
jgi:hypothetical protein